MKKGEQSAEKTAVNIAIPSVIQFCRITYLVDGLRSYTIELDIPQQDKSAQSLAKFGADGDTIDIAGVQFIIAAVDPFGGRLARFSLNTTGAVDEKNWASLVSELEHRAICVDFARMGQ